MAELRMTNVTATGRVSMEYAYLKGLLDCAADMASGTKGFAI